LASSQGEKLREQRKYQFGYFAKQALVELEGVSKYLWYRKDKLPMCQIEEQVLGQIFSVEQRPFLVAEWTKVEHLARKWAKI